MSALIGKINSILASFAKANDAELTTIEEVEWKGEPQSFRLKKYLGSDWEPLYQVALAVDLALIQAQIELRKEAEAKSPYIYQAAEFFLEYTKSKRGEEMPCTCGGTLALKTNSKTGMGFYSCSNWRSGCKVTKNLLKEDADFSKRMSTKLTGRNCPKCSKSLIVRMAKTGKNAGKEFIGCTGFPACAHTEKM